MAVLTDHHLMMVVYGYLSRSISMWRLARHKTIDPDFIFHRQRGGRGGVTETGNNECRLLWGLIIGQECWAVALQLVAISCALSVFLY